MITTIITTTITTMKSPRLPNCVKEFMKMPLSVNKTLVILDHTTSQMVPVITSRTLYQSLQEFTEVGQVSVQALVSSLHGYLVSQLSVSVV